MIRFVAVYCNSIDSSTYNELMHSRPFALVWFGLVQCGVVWGATHIVRVNENRCVSEKEL